MFSARSTLLVGAVAAISALPAVLAADQRSMSRVININSVTDFCLYAPPDGGEVAQFEAEEVAYCLRDGYGTRVMPSGTIQSEYRRRSAQRTPCRLTDTSSWLRRALCQDAVVRAGDWYG